MVSSGAMFQAGAKEKMESTVVGGIIKKKMEISKAKHMLWQFNGIADRDPYVDNPHQIRSVAVFGERGLIEWSWLDRNVKFYFYLLQSKFLNFFARKFVYKNWEPGYWPIPWAAKGEHKIELPPPAKENGEIKQQLKDLEDRLKKAGDPSVGPKQNN